jgi:hypothetical protein
MTNIKFMQTLENPMYRELKQVAKRRRILLQEVLRAVVIPEWLESRGRNKPDHQGPKSPRRPHTSSHHKNNKNGVRKKG